MHDELPPVTGRPERAVLASGRTLELFRYAKEVRHRLEDCPDCGGDWVQPLWWEQQPHDQWRVMRWCPECHWSSHGLYEQADLERYDEVLDRGMDVLRADLRRLTAETMELELAVLSRVLADDLVSPDDFAR
jgi:hypothetical protein